MRTAASSCASAAPTAPPAPSSTQATTPANRPSTSPTSPQPSSPRAPTPCASASPTPPATAAPRRLRALSKDTGAPDTTIDTKPAALVDSTTANFTFSGNDGAGSGVASFECRIDAGAWGTCTSPREYTSLAEGNHSFEVKAIDQAGNTDATPATYSWTVDTTGPAVQIELRPLRTDQRLDPDLHLQLRARCQLPVLGRHRHPELRSLLGHGRPTPRRARSPTAPIPSACGRPMRQPTRRRRRSASASTPPLRAAPSSPPPLRPPPPTTTTRK